MYIYTYVDSKALNPNPIRRQLSIDNQVGFEKLNELQIGLTLLTSKAAVLGVNGRETPALEELPHATDQDADAVFSFVGVYEDRVVVFVQQDFQRGCDRYRIVVKVRFTDIGEAELEYLDVVLLTPTNVFFSVFLIGEVDYCS